MAVFPGFPLSPGPSAIFVPLTFTEAGLVLLAYSNTVHYYLN